MSNAKVSIIVPVYNSAAYLSACIASIVRQTYKNIEVLLIDDGSTDDSFEICTRFAADDERIKAIHQENKGVSAARNHGLDRMSGDYFAFVDSDDELKENAIELLMNDILEHNADMASGVYSMVLTNGSIVSLYEDHSLNVYSGKEMLCLSLEGDRQTNSACAKLYRNSIFHSIRFVEGRSINEDGFYLFQCYMLQPVVVQHNVSVYLYYVREDSNSRNAFSEKYFDMMYFCEQKKALIKSLHPEFSDKLVIMEVSVNLFFLEILCRTKDKKYLQAQKNSINLVKKHYKQFTCINKHERQMAWIVAHGLYPIYKAAVYFKYYR